MSTILAIDLGGTRLRAASAKPDDPGALAMLGDWPAPRSLAEFDATLRRLLGETGATRLGCAIPGLARGSICAWVPNLPFLDGVDLALRFAGVSIGLGNDAQLALLAEREGGAARSLDDAILLAIGTGIGSAVLAGGSILRGSTGAACSFGWASADVDDPGEDRSGWLERQASGRALDGAAAAIGLADGRALIEKARLGDGPALAALHMPMTALGTALAGAVALLDPKAIILAGGVAAATETLSPLIRPALDRHLPPHLRGIEIRAGHFGPGAGLTGAAFAGRAGENWGRSHD